MLHDSNLRALAVATLAGAFLLVTTAEAGKRRKPEPEPEPEPVHVAPPPPQPVTDPFAAPLPFPTPARIEGMANLSAQGCMACHPTEHTAWAEGGHGPGWNTERLRKGIHDAGTPACSQCHSPMTTQQAELISYDNADVNRPQTTPNDDFDATLHLEGVTCITCHVRDGAVLTARQDLEGAPHPLAYAPQLATSEACATCHQLTWPGANKPLYDTYGEFSRSPHAEAGMTCQSCHGPGADPSQSPHEVAIPASRAVSLLVDLPGLTVVRGDEPVKASVIVQNTGAGHHFPTGSPWRGVDLVARLVGPADRKGQPTVHSETVVPLARTLEGDAPWNTLEDTRIPAGQARDWEWSIQLPQNSPTGAWFAEVSLFETWLGERSDAPIVQQRWPIQVE